MPGLMNRASTVVKARISKLLDRAEDPSITLDYSYEKQRELLQNVKRGVADVVTAKKRLELQSQKLEQEIEKLAKELREGKLDKAAWDKLFTDITPTDLAKNAKPFPIAPYFNDILEGYEKKVAN